MEQYTQVVILLLLIVLLVDRFYNKSTSAKPPKEKSKLKPSNSIMGESKEVLKQQEVKKTLVDSPDKSIDKTETQKIIPTEDLDTIFNSSPSKDNDVSDWEELKEEEEELKPHFSNQTDQDFNTGLSFEELQKIAKLLNQKELTNDTLPVAMKIENTELLEILNEKIPKAQQHVSDLLNTHLATHSSSKINDDWRDFDIGDFV
ncbi:hypothetical protein [Tenacibaculum jejuense]|uniref:Conjugative transposon protein TraD n=1 Tax=Tenacibaculum jejuense TaxID=584609 RepID=A0A238U766_9FLAO|nr:hypothetical protein [Tenacibaculum jejuense]SNR14438.1 Conjugative transposon protein TraD [Tenacibaculum jejuense]